MPTGEFVADTQHVDINPFPSGNIADLAVFIRQAKIAIGDHKKRLSLLAGSIGTGITFAIKMIRLRRDGAI